MTDKEKEMIADECDNLLKNFCQSNKKTNNSYDYVIRNGNIIKRPTVKNIVKIGRNDLCPCGSGKKYKKCCGK